MRRKILWTTLTVGIGSFALVAGELASSTEVESGCFTAGWEGDICHIVQICTLGGCGYRAFIETPPCRPGGSGPTCS